MAVQRGGGCSGGEALGSASIRRGTSALTAINALENGEPSVLIAPTNMIVILAR